MSQVNGCTNSDDLRCNICSRQFDRPSRLRAHYQTHTGERPIKCPYCDKGFSSKGNCITHMRVHTLEKPYECPRCDKKYSQHSQLVIHVRTHTGEKPFVCDICKKGFTCSKVLKIHIRTHTGEKPFECEFCHRGFAAYANLVVHRRTHTKERPYVCRLCGRGFEHSGNLSRHVRGHQTANGIRCIPCGQVFQEESDLTIHCANEHPTDAETEDTVDKNDDGMSQHSSVINFIPSVNLMENISSNLNANTIEIENTRNATTELTTIDSSAIELASHAINNRPNNTCHENKEQLVEMYTRNVEGFDNQRLKKQKTSGHAEDYIDKGLVHSNDQPVYRNLANQEYGQSSSSASSGSNISAKPRIKMIISNTSSRLKILHSTVDSSFIEREPVISQSPNLSAHVNGMNINSNDSSSNFATENITFRLGQVHESDNPPLDLSSNRETSEHLTLNSDDGQNSLYGSNALTPPSSKGSPVCDRLNTDSNDESLLARTNGSKTKAPPPDLIPLEQQQMTSVDTMPEEIIIDDSDQDYHQEEKMKMSESTDEKKNYNDITLDIKAKLKQHILSSDRHMREQRLLSNEYLSERTREHKIEIKLSQSKCVSPITDKLLDVNTNHRNINDISRRNISSIDMGTTRTIGSKSTSVDNTQCFPHDRIAPSNRRIPIPFTLDILRTNIKQSLMTAASSNQMSQDQFKLRMESAVLFIVGDKNLQYFGYPGRTIEQVLISILDMARLEPCADVRINEVQRLKLNFRKLLMWTLDEQGEWERLNFNHQPIETIVETLAASYDTNKKTLNASSDINAAINSFPSPTVRSQSGIPNPMAGNFINSSNLDPRFSNSGITRGINVSGRLPSLFKSAAAQSLPSYSRTFTDARIDKNAHPSAKIHPSSRT